MKRIPQILLLFHFNYFVRAHYIFDGRRRCYVCAVPCRASIIFISSSFYLMSVAIKWPPTNAADALCVCVCVVEKKKVVDL